MIYNPDARCPKCDHDEVDTRYQATTHGCREHRVSGGASCCDDEHFDRRCARCGYVWREEVDDWSTRTKVPKHVKSNESVWRWS